MRQLLTIAEDKGEVKFISEWLFSFIHVRNVSVMRNC